MTESRPSPSRRDKRVGIILEIIGFVMMLAVAIGSALDIYRDMPGWFWVIVVLTMLCCSALVAAGHLMRGGEYDPYDDYIGTRCAHTSVFGSLYGMG